MTMTQTTRPDSRELRALSIDHGPDGPDQFQAQFEKAAYLNAHAGSRHYAWAIADQARPLLDAWAHWAFEAHPKAALSALGPHAGLFQWDFTLLPSNDNFSGWFKPRDGGFAEKGLPEPATYLRLQLIQRSGDSKSNYLIGTCLVHEAMDGKAFFSAMLPELSERLFLSQPHSANRVTPAFEQEQAYQARIDKALIARSAPDPSTPRKRSRRV